LSIIAKGTPEQFWLEKLAAISERELAKTTPEVLSAIKRLSANLEIAQKSRKN
jgi:hypothetical protein